MYFRTTCWCNCCRVRKILPVLVIGSIVLGLVSLYKIFIMDKAKYIEDSKAFADRTNMQDMTVSLEPPSPKKKLNKILVRLYLAYFFQLL